MRVSKKDKYSFFYSVGALSTAHLRWFDRYSGSDCEVGRYERMSRVDQPIDPGMDGYQILSRELKLRIRTALLQAA
jgi:hypothetical protein